MAISVVIVEGDLLEQPVEVIVNPWNRNLIPWWLLLPQGVSGAIKRKGGLQPFWEIGKVGPMKLGSAVLTSAGKLPFRGIIHVAGINLLWQGTEFSIRESCRNAVKLAKESGFSSIGFPVIGSGSGGFARDRSLSIMQDELQRAEEGLFSEIRIVRYTR